MAPEAFVSVEYDEKVDGELQFNNSLLSSTNLCFVLANFVSEVAIVVIVVFPQNRRK